MMSAAPIPAEQYFLELVNRARANPAAEAARLGISLNEGLASGTITSSAKPPLAFNALLAAAASQHTQDMLQHNRFSHSGSDGATAVQRLTRAGYSPTLSAENLAWYGLALSVPDLDETVAELHRRLFLDSATAGRGHRQNLLNPAFREIGVGIDAGAFQDFNAVLVTANLASRNLGASSILTGVAYTDAELDDDFYTPGEGIGGVTITAVPAAGGATFSTTTWASGGYSLALPPGQYTVNASGGGLPQLPGQLVTIVDRNVKLDIVSNVLAGGGGGGKADKIAPQAKLDAPTRTHAGRSMLFRVTFSDDRALNAASIGPRTVRVTGRGFNRVAVFVSKVINKNGSIIATYRITGPGGGWDRKDNGKYAVRMLEGTVADESGNAMAAQKLGVISVQIGKPKKVTKAA